MATKISDKGFMEFEIEGLENSLILVDVFEFTAAMDERLPFDEHGEVEGKEWPGVVAAYLKERHQVDVSWRTASLLANHIYSEKAQLLNFTNEMPESPTSLA